MPVQPRRFRSVLAYAAFPMVGAATPFLAIPAISQHFGAQGWASIAVGQSVGAAASVAVELGWGLTGPQAVASSDRRRSMALLASSMTSRSAVTTLVVPVVLIIVYLLKPPDVGAALLAATAMCLSGLSLNWFFVGAGTPARIFWSDALPRLVSVLAGVLAITLLHAPLAVFAACLVVGYLASPVVGLAIVRPRKDDFREADPVRFSLRRQAVAVTGRGLSAVYIGLPVALVQAWAPGSVASFAAAERLMRMGLLVLQSVPNVLQRTLGLATRDGRVDATAARHTLTLQSLIGTASGIICALALPSAVRLLFAGKVTVDYSTSGAAGLIVLLTALSRATGMLLVAHERVHWVTTSAGVAAVAAFASLSVLPDRLGPAGAMLALAIAEALALAVQTFGLMKTRKEPSRHS